MCFLIYRFASVRRWIPILALICGSCRIGLSAESAETFSVKEPELSVSKTEEFEVDGSGTANAWNSVEWIPLNLQDCNPGRDRRDYETRMKVLYSETGLYVLMEATDSLVTSTMREDYAHLWLEDAFEVFLWPDATYPLYFEYEISPLGYELPIMVPNLHGKQLGWLPWNYEGKRRIRKATSAKGGKLESGATVSGWSAEFFIPFELLRPLGNVPPQPGAKWRANFYRIDRDAGGLTTFDWAPVGENFHDFRGFGTLIFK